MPTNNDPSPESFDDSTLPTPKDLPSSHQADEFATVIPANGIDDATFVPPVDADATYVPVRNSSSLISVESRVRYFGDYELISEIARGGMGVVYKARQTNLNRVVALKMILAGQFASEEDVQRFRTEAEAAANLDHPGIVPIYEIGQHEGQHFFSMGYVDGCSLADRVRNGPLPPKEAAELTKKIAEAIAFAHSRNVIHRDLKPANVLLDQNGEPKVTDFGLARKTDNDSGMTRTGAVMGTPSYMPPEQAAGRTSEVGRLSDVYSLGAILYCLLTGRPPFQAANPLDTLMQVMEREPVSVSTINPEIQRDLETVCHKCLQKEPSKRYASAQELAEDLGRWLRGEPITARAVSTTERALRWVRRNPLVSAISTVAAISILVGTTTSLIFAFRARAEAESAQAARKATEAALSESNFTLATMELEKERPLEAARYLQSIPVESRNLEWNLINGRLMGGEFDICQHSASVDVVKFSHDGRLVFSGSGMGLVISNAETLEMVHTIQLPKSWYRVGSAAFSLDNRYIAVGAPQFFSGSESELKDMPKVLIIDLSTGEITLQIFASECPNTVEFSPDGRGVLVCSGADSRSSGYNPRNSVVVFSTVDGSRVWSIEDFESPILKAEYLDSSGQVLMACPAGYFLAKSAGDVQRTYSGELRRTIFFDEKQIAVTPDGQYLAARGETATGQGTIDIARLSTGELVNTILTNGGLRHFQYFKDGVRLAAVENDRRIVVWNTMTNERETASLRQLANVTGFAICPYGHRIATGSEDGRVRMWDVTSLENGVRRLTNDSRFVAASSSDGKHLWGISKSWSISAWDCVTGETVRDIKLPARRDIDSLLLTRDQNTAVVSGGAGLRINDVPAGTVELWDLKSGQQRLVLCEHAEIRGSAEISPDGRTIACVMADGIIKIWGSLSGNVLHSVKVPKQKDDPFEPRAAVVRFLPDNKSIAIATEFRIAIVEQGNWEHFRFSVKSHSSGITSLAVSEDGRFVASGDGGGNIIVWDTQTLAVLHMLKDPGVTERGVSQLTFFGGNTRLLSISKRGQLVIWNLATGRDVFRYPLGDSWTASATILPDSSIAVATDKGLFHLKAGAGSTRFLLAPWRVKLVYLSDDDRSLIAESESGHYAEWRLSEAKSLPLTLLSTRPDIPLTAGGVDQPFRSPSGRWHVVFRDDIIQIFDTTLSGNDKQLARSLAAPRTQWHEEQADAFETSGNWYAASYHRAQLLRLNPADTWRFDDLHSAVQKFRANLHVESESLPLPLLHEMNLPRGSEMPRLTEESSRAVNLQIWELVRWPMKDGTSSLSNWHLQRMQDVCNRFPIGAMINTLGVLQYRLGKLEEAILSCNKSIELSAAETGSSEASAWNLGVLAMCHYRLGHTEKAAELRTQFLAAAALADVVLRGDIQSLLQEVQITFEPDTRFSESASIDEFNREAMFEDLLFHHWQFFPDERYVVAYSLSSERTYKGVNCLQANSQNGPVMAYQNVSVEPNTKYRLSGWIRYELPQKEPASESTSAAGGQTAAAEAAESTVTHAPTEPPTITDSGASIGLLNRLGTSEVISATTDWKQVSLEFTTESETTIAPGFRLGLEGQKVSGTAWFDDLKLEKVE
jgi:serine/threonine protein kinase/WD40 repeat protein